MKCFLLTSILFYGLAVHDLTAQTDSPPTYPKGFAGGEEVTTTLGNQSAGNASIVKTKDSDQRYIISSRHLLGPMGGFAKQTPAPQVPEFVKSVRISFLGGGSHSYPVIPLLVPALTVEAVNGNPINDLAIYELKDSADSTVEDSAVTLSETLPNIGDTLWVVSHVAGGVPPSEIIHSLKVDSVSGHITGNFENDKINPRGASGAPVLNGSGEVVGIYSAHSNEKGHVVAYIIPSTLIISVIKQDGVDLTP